MEGEPLERSSARPEETGVQVLNPGETCWTKARADRFAVIVDAERYFELARAAMLRAEHSIILIGWDFDLRIDLLPGRTGGDVPKALGDFLREIVRRKPSLRIWILKWDMAVLYTFGQGALRFFAHPMSGLKRIRLRFDNKHPWTAAHHQKIVVIDDRLAFCGGIDMTAGRWDTRAHRHADERRRRPGGSVAKPWHDATAVVDGAAARALGELARERWREATGERLPVPDCDGDFWPTSLMPNLRNVDVAIARTMPKYGSRSAVREIEKLYVAAIRSARRSIYLESQYFASVTICEELAARLRDPDGPEIAVVNPLTTKGWLEQQTMGTARDLRLRVIKESDRFNRFAIFHPVNAAGDPIYVHAKIMIVDDRLLRIGSSNVNNRSMGFDTECDLAVEVQSSAERAAIAAIRDDLLAEHLDVTPEALRETVLRAGSMLGAVRALRRDRGRSLRPLIARHVNDAQALLALSHMADPERPSDPEGRLEHIAKRLLLRLPPSAYVAAAILGGAGLFLTRRRWWR